MVVWSVPAGLWQTHVHASQLAEHHGQVRHRSTRSMTGATCVALAMQDHTPSAGQAPVPSAHASRLLTKNRPREHPSTREPAHARTRPRAPTRVAGQTYEDLEGGSQLACVAPCMRVYMGRGCLDAGVKHATSVWWTSDVVVGMFFCRGCRHAYLVARVGNTKSAATGPHAKRSSVVRMPHARR